MRSVIEIVIDVIGECAEHVVDLTVAAVDEKRAAQRRLQLTVDVRDARGVGPERAHHPLSLLPAVRDWGSWQDPRRQHEVLRCWCALVSQEDEEQCARHPVLADDGREPVVCEVNDDPMRPTAVPFPGLILASRVSLAATRARYLSARARWWAQAGGWMMVGTSRGEEWRQARVGEGRQR